MTIVVLSLLALVLYIQYLHKPSKTVTLTICPEILLIRNFLAKKPGSLEALIEHLDAREEPFVRTMGIYYSKGSFIVVDDDICGYEVKIAFPFLHGQAQLLECVPAYYGLTAEEGKRLYESILSCVPTSVFFERKMMARRGEHYGDRA
jgi:hypothetical protein